MARWLESRRGPVVRRGMRRRTPGDERGTRLNRFKSMMICFLQCVIDVFHGDALELEKTLTIIMLCS